MANVWHKNMYVELALFNGDTLLERGNVIVTSESRCCHLEHFHMAHHLEHDAAKIVLFNFSTGIKLKDVTLDMPIHQSEDWESLDLASYTLAFRCFLEIPQNIKT